MILHSLFYRIMANVRVFKSHLAEVGLDDTAYWLNNLAELGVKSLASLRHIKKDNESYDELSQKARNKVEKRALLELLELTVSYDSLPTVTSATISLPAVTPATISLPTVTPATISSPAVTPATISLPTVSSPENQKKIFSWPYLSGTKILRLDWMK